MTITLHPDAKPAPSGCYVAEPIVIRHPDRLFIGGEWVAPSTGETLSIVSPATEEEIAVVAAAGPADVDRAVAAARQAFDRGPWPRMSPEARGAALLRLADILERRAAEFAATWTAQVGVPISKTSRMPGIHQFRYYGGMVSTELLVERRPRAFGADAAIVKEPVGVVAAIVAWNAPMMLTSVKVAPALAMGCTVVLKSPPETPLEAFLLAECIEEAGLPPGVFNIVPADRAASEHLVAHAGIDKVAFTGSSATGLRIAEICARRLARYSLELGGKSAAIILDDIDMADVIPSLVLPSIGSAGQSCSALTRVLVSRKRHDEVVAAVAAAYGAARVGDPQDPASDLGPVAMKRQLDRVQGYIAKGLDQGAKIATGGGRPAGFDRGYYVEPTVFYEASADMIIAQEEIFGPVLTVIPYDDIDDAIDKANATIYGLYGTVYTHDEDAAWSIARRVRAGTMCQNQYAFDPMVPVGGFKRSGVGREGGVEGLLNFAETKAVFLSNPDRAFRK